jgi:hypothetical protein
MMKDGLGRLTRLSIRNSGDVSMLIDHLENLSSFEYGRLEDAIIERVLMKCSCITELSILPQWADDISQAFIPKVVEFCPLLERFSFHVSVPMESDTPKVIDVLSSLRHLKKLPFHCIVGPGFFTSLKRCKR